MYLYCGSNACSDLFHTLKTFKERLRIRQTADSKTSLLTTTVIDAPLVAGSPTSGGVSMETITRTTSTTLHVLPTSAASSTTPNSISLSPSSPSTSSAAEVARTALAGSLCHLLCYGCVFLIFRVFL